MFRSRLQRLDREAARRADSYVAISSAVQERIRSFYARDAVVIPPPVDVDEFHGERIDSPTNKPQFVWAGRLVPYKRPEAVIDLFRTLDAKLTMIGIGPLEAKLRATLPDNVRLLGWVPRREFVDHLRGAAGLVHLSEDDFGIVVAEALAAGTPVVALNRGGAVDIVRDGEDGYLVGSALEEQREAVLRTLERDWDRDALRRRAQEFSREAFLERFERHLAGLR